MAIPTELLNTKQKTARTEGGTMHTSCREVWVHEDAPTVKMGPNATSATSDQQPVGDRAVESAEDPLATLIQHRASDLIEAEFLWNPYLLADEFCTLAGPKGAGKSWITMDIATRVTMGTGFPGDEVPRPAPSSDHSTESLAHYFRRSWNKRRGLRRIRRR